jgi:uncharacterized RDD family membrane protein YckC
MGIRVAEQYILRMQPESDLVTGDAVVLELRLARLASRSIAFALDVLVQVTLLLLALLLLAGVGDVDGALLAAIMLTLGVLVLVGYPTIAETLSHGRTLGKLAMGLRTVRDDGGAIRFRHALTRALAGFFVDFWALGFLGVVAMTVSLCSEKGKRVGDFLAGTVVVRERAPEVTTAAITMPLPLAQWAAQLDLSNLPDDLALAGRQYLARYDKLGEPAREQLGHRLAGEVAERIGAPVPAWVPPWAYLSAVLSERRNREYAGRYAGHGQPVPPASQPPQPFQAPHPQPPQPAQPAQSPPDTDNPFTPPG